VTRVKICGVSDPADARLVADLGAWALGMVFWPQSPRACSVDVAEEIGGELHRRLELTGVFVNATLDDVAATADRCRLTLLQLHGDEGPAYCREAARRTGAKVMKAAHVHDAAQVHDLRRFYTDFHLLDAHSPRAPGGTGESFDWELALLHPRRPPVVLAGGLTPDNVARAIESTRPFGVDVASGTESEPGRKDPAKLEAFFAAVEEVDARLSPPATTEAVHP
jgi:phosphoribosylanthranilate isomerase